MKPLKIILTESNYFGGNSLCEHLRKNGEREIKIVGTDMNPNGGSRFYCDNFYAVPPGNDPGYIPALIDICKKEKPDLILPASSTAVYPLAFHKKRFEELGVKVMVSDPQTLEVALNKAETYHRLEGIIPIPKYFYTQRQGFITKPINGKGGRDFTIYDEVNMLVMEELEGEEIDIDVLSWNKEVLLCMCKTRERVYGGTLVEGKLVDRPGLIRQIKSIIEVIPIQYLSVIQFKGQKLLEINPRIAGMVFYPEDWNMPYLALKLTLGEITPQEIKKYQDKIPFGHRVSRYLIQKEYES